MKGNHYFMEYVVERYHRSFFNTKDMTVQEWHMFLGHPSATTMKNLNISNHIFHAEALRVIEDCEICYKARQTRNHFPTHNRRSYTLFHMVHGDVWGPYSKSNICDVKYVLTLVEDHSRITWTYLMNSKEQVQEILKSLFSMVEVHFQQKVKFFRSDHGSEFINHRVSTLLSER